MLFVQVGKQHKRKNSQKQLFTDVLQNSCSERFFLNIVKKQLCWSLLLIKLQTWRTPTQLFSCEYCELLKNSFLWNASRLWVQSWYFSYSLCHCFVFLHNSIRISISWLFHTCFYTKIATLVKCNFLYALQRRFQLYSD